MMTLKVSSVWRFRVKLLGIELLCNGSFLVINALILAEGLAEKHCRLDIEQPYGEYVVESSFPAVSLSADTSLTLACSHRHQHSILTCSSMPRDGAFSVP